MQECSKEAPMINGHTHLVNGALKPEDLSPFADQPSVDKDLAEYRVKSPEHQPTNPPVNFQTKPDPYEFPHSPPKQSDHSVVHSVQSSSQEASEQRPKLPPPTYEEAIKATESHSLPQQLQPSCQVDSNPINPPVSPSSHNLSQSPVRLNGSHQNAFSSHPASLNTSKLSVKPDPPAEKPSASSSESSAHLLAQTGGLISEFYSHSRLHQIATWRTGFSEYVNELHSKRKGVGVASFSGLERLRKSVAQRSTDSRGNMEGWPTFLQNDKLGCHGSNVSHSLCTDAKCVVLMLR